MAQLAPAADLRTLDQLGDEYVAELAGDGTVQIPTEPSGEVTASSGGTQVALTLPVEGEIDDATISRGSTVVYQSAGPYDLAVQALGDGFRVQAVLNDSSAPATYRYGFGDLVPVLEADGSVLLTATSGGATMSTVGLLPPWAFDANGVEVPTRYEIDGNAVVQVVDHHASDFAYPIVADPTVSFGLGAYVWYNKAETKSISGMGWASASFAAICTAAGVAIGGGVGAAALGAACLVEGGSIVYEATLAVNKTAEKPKSPTCVRLRWWMGSTNPATYKGGNCK